MARPARTYWRCPECGEPIIRARTEAMNWQLLDPVPNEAGNVHAYQANGNWHARSVPPRTPAVPPDALYMPHKATCKGKPEGAESAPEPPENVTQIATWKKAGSGHSARQRGARSTTRQPGVTGRAGYRAWPGGQR